MRINQQEIEELESFDHFIFSGTCPGMEGPREETQALPKRIKKSVKDNVNKKNAEIARVEEWIAKIVAKIDLETQENRLEKLKAELNHLNSDQITLNAELKEILKTCGMQNVLKSPQSIWVAIDDGLPDVKYDVDYTGDLSYFLTTSCGMTNLFNCVALLDGKNLPLSSSLMDLLDETFTTRYLRVCSKISFNIICECGRYEDITFKGSLQGKSTIQDLLIWVKSKWKQLLSGDKKSTKWELSLDQVQIKQAQEILSDRKRLLAECRLSEPFKLSWNCTSLIQNIDAATKVCSPASYYAGFPSFNKFLTYSSNQTMSFCRIELMNHRKCLVGNHVSLYYEGFEHFKRTCQFGTADESDCLFAMELCTEMSCYFTDEKSRNNALVGILRKYLSPDTKITQAATTPSGGKCDVLIDDWVYVEIRLEVGTGGSDTSSEGISHFLSHLKQYIHRCPVPAFIIEVVGPNMFVSGIAYGDHVSMDRLIPSLYLVPHYHDWKAMESIALVLKALKEGIVLLKQYYTTSIPQPRFPYFRSFEYGNTMYNILYQKVVGDHMFLATVNGLSDVYIKFTEKYSKVAHQLLDRNNFAPKLYYCEQVWSYTVVVMEYVSGGMQIDTYLSSNPHKQDYISKQCDDALGILHANGYCHGDFRAPNILVRENGTICVVDFEWSGKDARYPLFMNHVNIEWPQGATDGQLVLKSHDIHWKNQLFQTSNFPTVPYLALQDH